MRFSLTYPIISQTYDRGLLEQKNLIRFAQAAEEAGFDAIGFTDHPAPSEEWMATGGHDALDPFAALSFCAAATERIRLMPNIVVLPYRNPLVVAKAVSTIDVLSGGRFTLSTAPGYMEAEYEGLGVSFEDRHSIFDESIEVMKGIWSQDDFRHEGKHFRASGLTANPKPIQQPHPPIWIGGNSRQARRRVARYAQGWNPFPASPRMAQRAKTLAVQTTEQLSVLLDDLWLQLEAMGRDRSEIDVQFINREGGLPANNDFNADAHLNGLQQLAELGITWTSVATPGDSVEQAIETLERYGQSVIAHFPR
ncbi:LLM class F420-dependent oxidoreductase [Myxococcota bacterium]|nr:LLM class F420-dependent oxidoreductase [Myxococcota bacterium]